MSSTSKPSRLDRFFRFGFPRFVLAFILFIAPVLSQAQVKSKLQWFDSHGEIIDLDWATSIQWKWTQDRVPAAQVIITIPEQLNLASNDDNVRFLGGVPDREGRNSNRTLVVDMDGPRKTIKLKKIDPASSDVKEVGLTILLNTDSPNVIPSESCEKEGISVEPRQAQANFIFLAVSCKKTPTGLRISVESSNDALIGRDEDEKPEAHSAVNPLLIFVPKKNWEQLKPDMVVATIKAVSQTTPSITTQFELVYTKDSVTNEPHLAKAPAPLPVPLTETKPWSFTAELGFGFLGYIGQKSVNSGDDPSEDNLGAKFTAEHSLFGSKTHFKGDLETPIITLMPNAHFAASGLYKGTARVSFPIFDRGKIAFHLEPGLEMGGANYRERSDISGFYVGPVAAAYLNGTIGGLGNRAMGLMTSVAALAGRGLSPTFNSWDISTELSVEMIKGEAEKRWDALLRFEYFNFHSPSSSDARSTELMMGIRTGL